MGSDDNITDETFKRLGEKLKKTPEQTKQLVSSLLEKQLIQKEEVNEPPEVTEMFVKATKAWGQSKEEAKKNTYDVLKINSRDFMK